MPPRQQLIVNDANTVDIDLFVVRVLVAAHFWSDVTWRANVRLCLLIFCQNL